MARQTQLDKAIASLQSDLDVLNSDAVKARTVLEMAIARLRKQRPDKSARKPKLVKAQGEPA